MDKIQELDRKGRDGGKEEMKTGGMEGGRDRDGKKEAEGWWDE